MMGLFLFSGIIPVCKAQVTKSKETIRTKTIIKTNPSVQHEGDKSKILKKHINLIYPAKTDKSVAIDTALKWDVANYSNPDNLRFDVYFGTNADAITKVSSGQINKSYEPTLDYNTTYYWKVDITGSEEEVDKSLVYSFKTKPFIQWDDDKFGTFTDPRDNKSYKVVKIGEQVWFAENLAYLPNATKGLDANNSGYPNYYVYDHLENDIEIAKTTYNYKTYGVLYNWAAATGMNPRVTQEKRAGEYSDTNPSGVQGACPSGWHVPSNDEWNQLIGIACDNEENSCDIAGKGLAAKSIWNVKGAKSDDIGFRSTNNYTGFTALPGGYTEIYSTQYGFKVNYKDIGSTAFFWTTSKANHMPNRDHLRTCKALRHHMGNVIPDEKSHGQALSVRCVKD